VKATKVKYQKVHLQQFMHANSTSDIRTLMAPSFEFNMLAANYSSLFLHIFVKVFWKLFKVVAQQLFYWNLSFSFSRINDFETYLCLLRMALAVANFLE